LANKIKTGDVQNCNVISLANSIRDNI